MEINSYTNAIKAYKNPVFEKDIKSSSNSINTVIQTKTKNVDVADFSVSKKSLDSMKASIAAAVDADLGTDGVNSLQAKISEGGYNFTGKNILSKILEG